MVVQAVSRGEAGLCPQWPPAGPALAGCRAGATGHRIPRVALLASCASFQLKMCSEMFQVIAVCMGLLSCASYPMKEFSYICFLSPNHKSLTFKVNIKETLRI